MCPLGPFCWPSHIYIAIYVQDSSLLAWCSYWLNNSTKLYYTPVGEAFVCLLASLAI